MHTGDSAWLASDFFPDVTFLLCIIGTENNVLTLKPSSGLIAPGNVTVWLSMLTWALLDELKCSYVFMNKTHLPLHTSIRQRK